jgi:type III restriction enzyme
VRDAIATRQRLHDLALHDKDFIQPIVLFQAENKGQEVTVDVLAKFLVEEEAIPRERIAIATDDQKELDGVNLLDPGNTVQFVITVQALKEGWDCPFAYVFCSVARVYSVTAVEQLLGRVLQMPYAQSRTQPELNRAYAHVASTSWPQAVGKLYDRLVSMGFNAQEAQTFIEPQPSLFPTDPAGLQPNLWQTMTLTLDETPDLSSLTTAEQAQVQTSAHPETDQITVTISGPISDELGDKLVRAAPKTNRAEIKNTVILYQNKQRQKLTPSQKGEIFTVPQLAFWIDGAWEQVDEEWFLDADGWDLLAYPTQLSEAEFSIKETAESYLIDLNGKQLITRYVDARAEFDLGLAQTHWTVNELSRRLDHHLRQPDIRQEVLLEFIRRTVTHLIEKRDIPLATLARHRYPLIKALQDKIKQHRDEAYGQGYQARLLGGGVPVETNYEYAFTFDPNNYPAKRPYAGPFQFNKHFYPLIDDLNHDGEEFKCAQAIDRDRDVKHWVRNLVNEQYGYRLRLAHGWFYPDFVAELRDGRLLVVEYKGAHIEEKTTEQHKRSVGEKWEENSGGKGLFLFAVKRDEAGRDVYGQLEAKILGG